MKAAKTFDCLRMKREHQAKLHKKWAGLTTEEIQAVIQRDLANSQTDLAKWWRRMEQAQAKKHQVARESQSTPSRTACGIASRSDSPGSCPSPGGSRNRRPSAAPPRQRWRR
jgi:hypothetical protein